ncbi:hypothetical protein GUA87_05520 [Sneathiella sp. P13V-1]|uniref:hypothetical protein n=1 Tax=Sneathiella sp. P13V-1 TaxID=2697366 RepID=UPI00187B5757|nr:hypothetical protein [Sneathiella sp. P13V-1]MBE7636294.1 hypothetical protein [Sneathiella sp. P13V-1]
MVRISGTLSSNVTLSSRLAGGQPDNYQRQVNPVEKLEKPVVMKDQRPNMTFSGLGRRIDINV